MLSITFEVRESAYREHVEIDVAVKDNATGKRLKIGGLHLLNNLRYEGFIDMIFDGMKQKLKDFLQADGGHNEEKSN